MNDARPAWEYAPPTIGLSLAEKKDAWEECEARGIELDAELKIVNKLNNFAEIAQITFLIVLVIFIFRRNRDWLNNGKY